MNYSPDLLELQGLIISINGSLPFSKIQVRGGNEEKLLNIVSKHFKILSDKGYLTLEGYVSRHEQELRQICYYLVLNSDFEILDNLVDVADIGHMIWVSPTITKCILAELVWGLHLDKFAAEIISYANPILSLDLLSTLLSNMKYSKPEQIHLRAKKFLLAIYRHMARLILLDYPQKELSHLVSKFCDEFLHTINFFFCIPNVDKLFKKTTEQRYEYCGDVIKNILDLLIDCFDIFESIPEWEPEEYLKIYLCTKNEDIGCKTVTSRVCDLEEGLVKDAISKFNESLMDTCEANLIAISIDMFCFWSEREDKDGVSLQRIIGELAYKLNKILKTNSRLKHSLIDILPSIVVKPIELSDIIEEANEECLIENSNKKDENQHYWVQAIAMHKDLKNSPKLQECLTLNIGVCPKVICQNLTVNLMPEVVKSEVNDIFKFTILSALKNLDVKSQRNIIENHIFSDKLFNNHLQTENFAKMSTDLFNKLLTIDDSSAIDLLEVFIQNPRETLNNIMRYGLSNKNQAVIALDIFKFLKDFNCYKHSGERYPTIINALDEVLDCHSLNEKERNSLVLLATNIMKENLSDNELILLEVLLPKIYKFALNKDFSNLMTIIEVLSITYCVKAFSLYNIPILAQLAQLMQLVRWNLSTFNVKAPQLLEKIVDFVQKIYQSTKTNMSDKEKCWLKSKVAMLSPPNLYYFRELWDPEPVSIITSVLGFEPQLGSSKLIVCLALILPSCCSKEWQGVCEWLARLGPEGALPDLLAAVQLVTVAVSETGAPRDAAACATYCYRNFAPVAKLYIENRTTAEEIDMFTEKLVNLLNNITDDNVDEAYRIFLPVFCTIKDQRQVVSPGELNIEPLKEIKHEKHKDLVVEIMKKQLDQTMEV